MKVVDQSVSKVRSVRQLGHVLKTNVLIPVPVHAAKMRYAK